MFVHPSFSCSTLLLAIPTAELRMRVAVAVLFVQPVVSAVEYAAATKCTDRFCGFYLSSLTEVLKDC